MTERTSLIQLQNTADGSRTLYLPGIDEHYHSIKGALTESQHVFVDLGFKHSSHSDIRLLEIGFGTGLNAFLTLQAAEQEFRRVHYTSIELYPLELSTIEKLDYSNGLRFRQLHLAAWNEEISITSDFIIYKIEADFTRYVFSQTYDVIYFDAFAPEKQPEMWSQELFDRLYVITNKGGILTTYCAKGVVRRMLQAAGFIVERLPGPAGGKREVLRATKH